MWEIGSANEAKDIKPLAPFVRSNDSCSNLSCGEPSPSSSNWRASFTSVSSSHNASFASSSPSEISFALEPWSSVVILCFCSSPNVLARCIGWPSCEKCNLSPLRIGAVDDRDDAEGEAMFA